MIPWLWSAPEIVTAKSRKDRKFSHKSDVWSFGKTSKVYFWSNDFMILGVKLKHLQGLLNKFSNFTKELCVKIALGRRFTK